MRVERPSPVKRYRGVILFVAMGILLGAWHSRQTDKGQADPVAGTVRAVINPPATLMSNVSKWIGHQTGWIAQKHGMFTENHQLKAQLDTLQTENVRLKDIEAKYNVLRTGLNLNSTAGKSSIAADVIGYRPDPRFETLLINRGSLSNIKHNSIVLTRSGVIGHITEVGLNTSSVIMLTDQNSSVGARIQRGSSRAIGICKGNNSSMLTLTLKEVINDADVKVGDQVVTSGFGGLYQPGYLLGTVKSIQPGQSNVGKTVLVTPIVNFHRLEEVFVLP